MVTKTKAKERQMFECKKCGWEWFSTMNPPIVCPKCHSAYWNQERRNEGK